MSAPSSQSTQPTPTTFNERLNEQLINCLNIQTNVIQNLTQYSQHISLQLFEIKGIVELLSNRVLTLQQQQQPQYSQQSHYASTHFAPSYYQNYAPPPSMPGAHPPPSMPHPSSSMSYPPVHPSVPFSIPQQFAETRPPVVMTTTASSNLPFSSQSAANPPLPSSSNASSFQFSASSIVPPVSTKPTNILPPPPTTTASSQSFFSNQFKLNMVEIPSKAKPLFSTTTINHIDEKQPSNSSTFAFGTTEGTPNFGIGTSTLSITSTAKTETNVDDDGDGGGEDDSYEPNVSFKPIVQLSAVEVKTGEEDENVLFCERAKLYRFDAGTNQMKERGVGEIKILQHKTNRVCRILMRREQVLKLCANHQISSQMQLKSHQGSANAYVWSAMDYADGEAKHETLCVRFKTEEQAKKFAKVFNESNENNAQKSSDAPTDKKSTSKDEGKTKSTTNDDDVISIGEVTPSAEQIDRAKKLQLPSTFYLYEKKDPCKGCPGCEDDSPPIVSIENKTAIKKPTDVVKNETKSTVPQTVSAPKTPLSSSENIKLSFANSEKVQPQIQKPPLIAKEDKPPVESSPTADNPAAQYDTKPSIFGNLNGTSNSSIFGSLTPSNNNTGSVFGGASLRPSNGATAAGFSFPGFGNTTTATTPSSGFVFSTPAAATAASTSSTFTFGTSTSSENKPVFANTPKFSFAELAKQSTTSSSSGKATINGGEQRVFAGQGSLIFGTNSVTPTTKGNNHDDDDGDGGGEDDSYEPNVSFKPIVQLSAVEVKTGEEDEDVLFCERAKLYRFDAETNQMKERGVGEIKILQHKTNRVCRILMRREQVLKLCANHQISSQMQLKPHQGSENAYVWSAMDYADGEAKHETLCVRFKSSDLAKKFVKQFNEAQQATAH